MATRNVPAVCPHCGSRIRKAEDVPNLREAIEIEIARNRLIRIDRGCYVDGVYSLTINDVEFTANEEEVKTIWPWLLQLWQNSWRDTHESPIGSQS